MSLWRRGDSCAAERKLRDWLAQGATRPITFKHADFGDRPFSLTALLFSAPLPERLRQIGRSFCVWMATQSPLSGWKVFWCRRAGVRIGKNVFISPDVVIDLLFPQLITLEDEAVLGLGAIVTAHVYTPERIAVGRSRVGRRALVGGRGILSINEIGEEGVLGPNSWLIEPVPAGHIAIGMPPIVYERKKARSGPSGESTT
jgi:acetyltransferase-like isoleucine patch superfamily enzyme